MESVRRWYNEDRGKRAVEALKKRGFRAHYVETQAQAKEMILKEIPQGATVGVGDRSPSGGWEFLKN